MPRNPQARHTPTQTVQSAGFAALNVPQWSSVLHAPETAAELVRRENRLSGSHALPELDSAVALLKGYDARR